MLHLAWFGILFSISAGATSPFLNCAESPAKLFSEATDSTPLEIDVVADHSKLNDPKIKWDDPSLPISAATVTYRNQGIENSISSSLRPRGRSRFSCDVRPYKLIFNEPQTGNFFEGLGDDVKIVNPCARSDGGWPGTADPALREARLLNEYTLYRIFETLGTFTLKTRLAKIRYRNADGSLFLETNAFFREPEGKAAKRCGLKKIDQKTAIENKTSAFFLDFMFAFLGSADYSKFGENVEIAKNAQGETFYLGYDFDSSPFVLDALTMDAATLNQMKNRLNQALSKADPAVVKAGITEFLSKKDAMLQIIDTVPMETAAKTILRQKFLFQVSILETF